MTTSMIRRNLIEKFVMTEFVNNRMNTQGEVDKVLVMVKGMLDMSNDEAKGLVREVIGLATR